MNRQRQVERRDRAGRHAHQRDDAARADRAQGTLQRFGAALSITWSMPPGASRRASSDQRGRVA
ncbi:hypothetical protein OZ671_06690 [Phreatobacter sp. AB_2022a]|nr:hypothetical protein [Phreatobacter sp. AB_2022a]MCZ0733920.1 hypothetical protein [Phreatobacter sp. AB_2022a]